MAAMSSNETNDVMLRTTAEERSSQRMDSQADQMTIPNDYCSFAFVRRQPGMMRLHKYGCYEQQCNHRCNDKNNR